MSAADEVATLLMQIRKDVCRNVSIVILKYLDQDFRMPEDIAGLQNLQRTLLQELNNLKESLDKQVGIVEKTELIKNILKYKLYEIRFVCRKEIEKLQKKKESLTKMSTLGQEDSSLALKITEVADDISNLEETHIKSVDFIKEQKVQAEKAYEQAVLAMDYNLEKLIKGCSIFSSLIEAEKCSLSHSEAQLLASKFSEDIALFETAIERFIELQSTGWRIVYQEEKIVDMLQERGLKVLYTGELITDEGQIITFREARDSKLLENIGPNELKEIRTHLNEESNLDDDSCNSKSTFSLKSISDTPDNSETRISSTDLTYLKDRLGKPLTLALYEVATLQPTDPIQYLSHWLFKYRYNLQFENPNSDEYEILNTKRNQLTKEKAKKKITDEVMTTIFEMIDKAQDIACMNAVSVVI